MATQRGLARLGLGVMAALMLGVILNFPAAGLHIPSNPKIPDEERKEWPEDRNLIESLDGPSLFLAYCATCHGRDAKGNGPAASALKTAPADLTRISQRNGGKFPFARVEKIISGEELNPDAHGSREMPIWGPIFGQIAWDQDLGGVRIYRITRYLETLQERPAPGKLPFTPLPERLKPSLIK